MEFVDFFEYVGDVVGVGDVAFVGGDFGARGGGGGGGGEVGFEFGGGGVRGGAVEVDDGDGGPELDEGLCHDVAETAGAACDDGGFSGEGEGGESGERAGGGGGGGGGGEFDGGVGACVGARGAEESGGNGNAAGCRAEEAGALRERCPEGGGAEHRGVVVVGEGGGEEQGNGDVRNPPDDGRSLIRGHSSGL